MGDKYGSSNNLPNGGAFGSTEKDTRDLESSPRAIPSGFSRWVAGGTGGFLGGLLAILYVVNPTINTWLQNAKEFQQSQKEVQLAQVKTNQEQINYITKRMEDSDKERDLYKSEMLSCQKEIRELRK